MPVADALRSQLAWSSRNASKSLNTAFSQLGGVLTRKSSIGAPGLYGTLAAEAISAHSARGRAMQVPAVGDVLAGKYAVEAIVGRGGMGVVLAARHLELDERVAIKLILTGEAPLSPEFAARFVREAKLASKIKSQHVVRVIDVARLESGEPYIVMELLEGHDLSELLTRYGPMPVDQAALYLLQACEALAEAHS